MSVKILNLQLMHGVAGARDQFEQLVYDILFHKNPDVPVRKIRCDRGDGGIDIFVGDWEDPEGIDVYQVKFFPTDIGKSQKDQITASFKRAKEDGRFNMKSWTLCLPIDMSIDENVWFASWKKRRATSGVQIKTPLEASRFESLLKGKPLAEVRQQYFRDEQLTLTREIREILDQLSVPAKPKLALETQVQKLSIVRYQYVSDDPVLTMRADIVVTNIGDEAVRQWSVVPSFPVIPSEKPILTSAQLSSLHPPKVHERPILSRLSDTTSVEFGLPLRQQMLYLRHVFVCLEPVVMELTPVTEAGSGDTTTFQIIRFFDQNRMNAELGSVSRPPIQVLPPVGGDRW